MNGNNEYKNTIKEGLDNRSEIKNCTMCGKELTLLDDDFDLTFDMFPGEGSRYDLSHLHMELCYECFDKIIDWIRPQCKVDPIIEEDVDDGFGVSGEVLSRYEKLCRHLSVEGIQTCTHLLNSLPTTESKEDYVEMLESVFDEISDCNDHKEHQKGVFWVIDNELHAFPFTGEFAEAIAKSGQNYNHKLLWEFVKPHGCNKPFDYYPRGRVETNAKGCPIIYMNPNIGADFVPFIKQAFEIRQEPVIHYDGSWHYRCHLDNKEDET